MRLYELNHIAASVIGDSFPEPLWVEGELYEGRVGGGDGKAFRLQLR